MKRLVKLNFIVALLFLFLSCEAFFTYNIFQDAANTSNLSADEAINSGNISIMEEVYDRIVEEASSASGGDAAELYIDAAKLASGISGMSDPSVILQATTLMDSGSDVNSLFAILTETGTNTSVLAGVDDLLENAEAQSPGSVSDDMWLFAAAGSAAEIVNLADGAGQDVDTYLNSTTGPDPLDNPDVVQACIYLVYAIDSLPETLADTVFALKLDLIDKGVVFP